MRESTLLEVQQDDERRCVVCRTRPNDFEVEEQTSGSLTYEVYGTPNHYHCVRLRSDEVEYSTRLLAELLGDGECADVEELLTRYFVDDHRFLADLMDDLDGWRVPYEYLNGSVCGSVSYRPQARGHVAYPPLRLVG